MKLKRFLAFAVSFAMVLSIVPAFSLTANATATDFTSEDFINLAGESVFTYSTAGQDVVLSTQYPGWSSSWSGSNNQGSSGAANINAWNDAIQVYGAGGTSDTIITPGFGVDKEFVVMQFYATASNYQWHDVLVTDNDGQAIESYCFANDGIFPGDGWRTYDSSKVYTESNDTAIGGYAASSNPFWVRIVFHNDKANDCYYVDYYTSTSENGTYTLADRLTYAGSMNGIKSIKHTVGAGDPWYNNVRYNNLKIYEGNFTKTLKTITVTYTVDGTAVAEVSKTYDTAEANEVEIGEYYYSANGSNTLYKAAATTLSDSAEIEMTAVESNREYEVVAHNGVQYIVKSTNLIPNGDFSYGLTGWYTSSGNKATNANFSAEDNTITILNGGGYNNNSEAALYRAWDVEVGKTYFLTFTLDDAIQWARVTEDDSTAYSETNIIMDANASSQGKNNLVFTATKEYVRTSFAWAAGRKLSSFGLYEIEEADEAVVETIKSVSEIKPVTVIDGEEINLPSTVQVEGALGQVVTGSITWNEPDSYTPGETTTVEGEVSAVFVVDGDALTAPVSVDVTVYSCDHDVAEFWHAGDNSDNANFGLYNYLGVYNGGVIVADTAFTATSGTNKLIMYGNSSSGDFGGTGALVRFMKDNESTPFEYYDGSWKQSDIIPAYNVNYVLRTTIDITNKTYTLAVSADGGEFVAITPQPAAFRNGNLNSIDRMISSGSMTIISHKTSWISGFSYLNVEYVDEDGNEIKDSLRFKTATGKEYSATDTPKLIETADALYIREDVSETPKKLVTEGEDTLTITYHEAEMTGFNHSDVNHVRGDATINLPTVVRMNFSDGQYITYPITWDTANVDKDALGEYEITGTSEGIDMVATATVKVRDVEILPKTTENTVATNNGGWNWYVEPSGTHIQPGDALATRYESGQYSSNNGYVFKNDKTYMGWVEDEGTIVVGEYNHKTDEYKRVVVHEFLEADDHNNPAVVVLPDGRIMIFYSKHTTEARMYYCVSKNPEDITEWNDWQYYYCYTAADNDTYPATYPSVFVVHDDEGIEGNDVIYVGWRGVHWKPTLAKFSIPDENGVCETLMGQTQFANTTYNTGSYADGGRSDGSRRPYTKYDYDFDRNKIYMTFTAHHPDNEINNHIYYLYLDIASQNLYTAKDTYLQPLPKENSADYASQGALGTSGQWGVIVNDLTDDYPELLVFNSHEQTVSGGHRRGWTWDIKVNEAGEPCIVYADITGTPPGEDGSAPTAYIPPAGDDTSRFHYYWYARWDTDTQQWVKTFLTYGGKWWHENATQERCYSGGLTFDHNAADANVIYLSIPTMGEYGNIFEIYRWESDDHGATWTIREPITENSKINNVRPNAIYNYKVDEDGKHQGPRLLWKSGEYRYWMNYEYKTGIWTDFAADGFITQDDPEMFADASLWVDGEKVDALPTGENITLTGKFNITNISIGDGQVYLAFVHYDKDNTLKNVQTVQSTIPARSVPQIGMIGAPKFEDGSLSPMGTEEIIEEIDYTATIEEGDKVKLLAWNVGIEHPMSSIISVPFETSTSGNKYAFYDTFTYEGTEKLILDANEDTYNGWVSKTYGVDGAAIADNNYAAITKAPFGNTGLHIYGISSDGSGIMASHALPDTQGKDYQIKFSMRYIDEMSWNNTQNAGFTLSHGVPVYNSNTSSCAIQFRHSTAWGHLNGRNVTGSLRYSRDFDDPDIGTSWIFGTGIYSEYGRGNEYDGLMTGSNYEVTINVSPKNKTINFSIFDGHRTAYHSTSYVDANTYDWANNPIDTITFSVSGNRWGEIYVDDLSVEIME